MKFHADRSGNQTGMIELDSIMSPLRPWGRFSLSEFVKTPLWILAFKMWPNNRHKLPKTIKWRQLKTNQIIVSCSLLLERMAELDSRPVSQSQRQKLSKALHFTVTQQDFFMCEEEWASEEWQPTAGIFQNREDLTQLILSPFTVLPERNYSEILGWLKQSISVTPINRFT